MLPRDLSAAHAKWPPGWVATDAFLVWVAERSEDGAERDLAALYLACACVRGVSAAIHAFEAEYMGEVRRAVERTRLAPDMVDELTQTLRTELLVGREGARPKLAEYGGKGDLRGWLRVTATRAAIKVSKRLGKQAAAEGDGLLEQRSSGSDPDLLYLKASYGKAFREAFLGALEALDARDRNILRQHFLDGMTIDDLGAAYQVHRATAARWIQAAREELLKGTRQAFQKLAALRPDECDSVLRLVESRLDVTLRRLLS